MNFGEHLYSLRKGEGGNEEIMNYRPQVDLKWKVLGSESESLNVDVQ